MAMPFDKVNWKTMIKTNMPTQEEINNSKKEIVTVINRFGREVEVSLYQARKMIKRWEAEIKVETKVVETKKEAKTK